jgi:hypothetical protein
LYWGASTFENGKKGKGYAITNIRERLELLEAYSFESKDMAEWKEKLKGLFQTKEENLTPDLGLIVKILENSLGVRRQPIMINLFQQGQN